MQNDGLLDDFEEAAYERVEAHATVFLVFLRRLREV